MKLISTFSGMGGLDIGIRKVFPMAETVAVADIDKGANAVLAYRYPHVPNLGDVSTIDWSEWSSLGIDILAGSFPCQDLSAAGKREGLTKGTRSGLWFELFRACDELRPRYLVAENVPGLLSATSAESRKYTAIGPKGGKKNKVTNRAMGIVVKDMISLGYAISWVTVSASDIGAPHKRSRVFMVAFRDAEDVPQYDRDEVKPTLRLDDDRWIDGNLDEFGDVWPKCGVAIEGTVWSRTLSAQNGTHPRLLGTPQAHDAHGQPGDTFNKKNLVRDVLSLFPTPVTNDMGENKTVEWWDEWAPRQKSSTGSPAPHGRSPSIEVRKLFPTIIASEADWSGPKQRSSSGRPSLSGLMADNQFLLPTTTAADANASGSAGYGGNTFCTLTDAVVRQPERWGEYAHAVAQWENATRPAPEPTEPTGKGGAARLSPRFAEWMMGLDDGWITDPEIWKNWRTSSGARRAQIKIAGTGVVPQQCAYALRLILGDEAAS